MIASREDCRLESFMRSILLLQRRPAFMAYTTSGVQWRSEKTGVAPTAGKYPGPKLLHKQSCKRKWLIDYYATAGAHFGDLSILGHHFGHLPQLTAEKMMGNKVYGG